jgi:hypothetical protein
MTATRKEIEGWLDDLYNSKNATHMLVMCDQFDYEDYPVYVYEGQDPRKVRDDLLGDLTGFHECFNKSLDKQFQLNEHRAVHFD